MENEKICLNHACQNPTNVHKISAEYAMESDGVHLQTDLTGCPFTIIELLTKLLLEVEMEYGKENVGTIIRHIRKDIKYHERKKNAMVK